MFVKIELTFQNLGLLNKWRNVRHIPAYKQFNEVRDCPSYGAVASSDVLEPRCRW